MRTYKLQAVLAASVLGGLLAGCSSASDNDARTSGTSGGDRNLVAGASAGPSAAPSTLAEGMGSDQDTDGTFPRTVKHFQGSTTLKTEPRKVAVLSTGQLDDLLTLGVVPTATTRADNAGLVPGYLADAFPEDKAKLAAMTDAGTRQAPNLESLAAAKPDLILVNDSLGELYPKLSKIAPTVVTMRQRHQLEARPPARRRRPGQGAGRAAGARRDRHRRADRGKAVQGDPTVSMVRFTPDRTRMFGVSSFTGSIAVDMGLSRPASQRFNAISQDISSEKIDTADGDWIFYSVQGDAAKTDAASIVAGPLWKGMAAVKSGRAVEVDDDPWYLNAGPTAARLVVTQLAERLGR